MATENKEIKVSLKVQIQQAIDGTRNLRKEYEQTSKSLAELRKDLRALETLYANLTKEEREGAFGKETKALIEQLRAQVDGLNKDLKGTNKTFEQTTDAVEDTTKSIASLENQLAMLKDGIQTVEVGSKEFKMMAREIKKVENELNKVNSSMENVFSKQRLTEAVGGFGNAFGSLVGDGGTAEDVIDGVGEAFSKLGPYAAAAGKIGAAVLKGLAGEAQNTASGIKAIQGTMQGLKESWKALVSLRNPFTAFQEGAKAFMDSFDLKQQIAQIKALEPALEAAIEAEDKLQADTNKRFPIIKKALEDRLKAEYAASANRELIAQKELALFLKTEKARGVMRAVGIKNEEDLKKKQAEFEAQLDGETLEQYKTLQNQIIAESRIRVAKQAEFEKDYTDALRDELDRRLRLFAASANALADKSEYILDNRRLSLKEELQLEDTAYKSRKSILQKDLANIAQLTKEKGALHKEDEVRQKEIYGEIEALTRQHNDKMLSLAREATQRDIDLQESKNQSVINGLKDEVAQGKENLSEQLELIELIGKLQIETKKRTQANLNKEDKDYLKQYQDIQNEIEAITDQTNADILASQQRYLALQIADIENQMNDLATQRAQMLMDVSDVANEEIKATSLELERLAMAQEKNFYNLAKTMQVGKQNARLIREQGEANLQILYATYSAESKRVENEKKLVNLKLTALSIEEQNLQNAGKLTLEDKQRLAQQRKQIEAQLDQLDEQGRTIEVNLELDTKKAEQDTKKALSENNQATLDKLNEQFNTYKDVYGKISEVTGMYIDMVTEKQLAAIDQRIEASRVEQEYLLNNVSELNEAEQRATGARSKRLRKLAKEQQELAEQEAERQKQLEAEKEEIAKKAAKKKAVLEISNIAVNTAAAIMGTMAQMGGLPAALPFVIADMAIGAAQIASVASQNFRTGGMVDGPSHEQGGVKFGVGGEVVELEGGEAVINKRSTSLFKDQLSAINSYNNYGKKFAIGGITASPENLNNSDVSSQLRLIAENQKNQTLVVPVRDVTTIQDKTKVAQLNGSL